MYPLVSLSKQFAFSWLGLAVEGVLGIFLPLIVSLYSADTDAIPALSPQPAGRGYGVTPPSRRAVRARQQETRLLWANLRTLFRHHPSNNLEHILTEAIV